MNIDNFSNCYVIANEETCQAIIIDPCKITKEIINQIEDQKYYLCAALITHNDSSHIRGLSTLQKIYDIQVYAADSDIPGCSTTVIKGDGTINIAGLNVTHMSMPGFSADSMAYKIENVVFTGDVLSAGKIGETNSQYSKKILCTGIKSKIMSLNEDTIIMSGRGPLTSVAAEKNYNRELQ